MIPILIRQLDLAYRKIKGQALVEYALIIALVVVAILIALGTVGSHAFKYYQSFLDNYSN